MVATLTEETAQVLGYKEKREEVYDVRSIYQVTFKKDDSELTWVKAVVATSKEDAKEVFEEENQFEEIKSVRLLGTVVDELMDDGIGFENE